MNIFNKTEAAFFPMLAVLPYNFLFSPISKIKATQNYTELKLVVIATRSIHR